MADVDLSRFSVFEGFDQEALDKIEAMGEPVQADAGATIIEQGTVGQEAFVLVEGEAQILVNGHLVATVGPGSILGEMALLDLRPRSATVKAVTDVELMAYDAKHFRRIVAELPDDLRAQLIERDERFRHQNEEIAEADRPAPIRFTKP